MARVLLGLFVLFVFAQVNAASTSYTQNDETSLLEREEKRISEMSARHDLTKEQWTTYEEIMKGEGRFHWKDVEPLMVLGMYSKSEDEQRTYAKKLAIKEYNIQKRFIAMNNAYLDAFDDLYGHELILDMKKFYERFEKSAKKKYPVGKSQRQSNGGFLEAIGDKYIIFIKKGCGRCDKMYRTVLDNQKPGTSIDIHFVGGSDQDIRNWAMKMQIKPMAVKQGVVTLNSGDELYERYNMPGVPSVFYYDKSSGQVARGK